MGAGNQCFLVIPGPSPGLSAMEPGIHAFSTHELELDSGFRATRGPGMTNKEIRVQE
jgi:hypothetical protein